MTIQVLAVEPDQVRRDQLRLHLQRNCVEMSALYGPERLEQRIGLEPPSIIVLRHALPSMDGFGMLRQLREHGYTVPIIVVGESADVVDKVIAFELGANDYLTDPYDPRELVARIRNVLRIGPAYENVPTLRGQRLAFDDFELDIVDRRLLRNGNELRVRPLEFSLLMVFVVHPMKMLSRARILGLLDRATRLNERSLDVIVFRLRQVLNTSPRGRPYIQTLHGDGYMFCPDDALPDTAAQADGDPMPVAPSLGASGAAAVPSFGHS